MKPIVIVMLAIQAAMILVTLFAVAVRKPTVAKPRPIWSSFAASLLVVGIGSFEIARSHMASPGADVLGFGAAALFGMALMAALMAFRQRRGLDAAP